ncbi:MAG: hypoxanthine phosphoribosyltransferase [Humidesulfovibrio sp.]|nr:hypoxanthine phosphoribosyltransferase [Desulfovibrio sp.]MDO9081737.1 hypoxanthine phosphoribosyltransferase [Humidesulfovibrio sp.]
MAHKLLPVIPARDIRRRVAELGAEISAHYHGQQLVCVCVLKGAFLFFADLVRHITCAPEIDFVRLASYGGATSRGRQTAFTKDMEVDVDGRHVLLVEDIVDTGRTAEFLLHVLEKRGAASLKLCAFVDKHERREAGVTVDFAGFPIQKGFIVGYGMDYAEKYRELDAVYELVPE